MSGDIPEIHPLIQIAGADGWRLALPHDRAEHLLIWIARAQGSAVLDGQRVGISANTALFVPAGTFLALEAGPQLYGTAVILPDAAAIALPVDPHRLRVPAVQAQAELAALFEAMAREQRTARGETARDFHGAAARAHATLIAIWLRRALVDAPALPALRADQRLARAFCRLVVRDYRSGKPMAAYAEALGVTPSHLTRSCKTATGHGAADLLTRRSLHEARRLLADTGHPVGRIASHLGFGSAAYFTRFIQNHTGRTPTGLRAAAAARRGARP